MKKLLIVGCLLIATATPAFAQMFTDRNEKPIASVWQVSDSGNSAFAQNISRAKHPLPLKRKAQTDVGIFENLPAGVTDPYAYHNWLMQEAD
jgi:hypothetical protein